ncbi:MAG: DUF4191 domain-containing protein [Kineosporiaceae bacterium]
MSAASRQPTDTPARKGLARFRRAPGGGKGRVRQFWELFRMTRSADPAVLWWMLLAFAVTVGISLGLAALTSTNLIIAALLSVVLGVLVALVVFARRAETAAYARLEGQPGASLAALSRLRRGWTVHQEPVAVDPRTQDLVFRAVGRPGVVLITEGPLPRVKKLVEAERKRTARVLPDGVPILVLHSGAGEEQVPLRKLSGKLTRLRPSLSKTEASEINRRLKALGGVRMPIPKGVDPTRVRPDRRAMRGR